MQSVINRTLLQRQEVLKETVKLMEGEGTPVGQGTVNASVQLLLPGQGLRLPNFQLPGETYSERATCSERCTTLDQIETMFRASTDFKVCPCLAAVSTRSPRDASFVVKSNIDNASHMYAAMLQPGHIQHACESAADYDGGLEACIAILCSRLFQDLAIPKIDKELAQPLATLKSLLQTLSL